MSKANRKGTLEGLLRDLGSFGRFQVTMMQCVLIPKGLAGFSLVLPSFTAAPPDWWCLPVGANLSQSQRTNETFKVCSVNGSGCVREYGSNMVTSVSEWDLVCDKRWVSNAITSIQMAGILVGVVLAGQLSDSFGRKKVFYSAVLAHSVWNFLCPLSVSWEMFAVLRFLIGVNGGSILCTSFPYMLEFTDDRWRPVLGAIPYWPLSVAILALTSWLLPNWKYLHCICGALNAPFVIGYFFLPESLRWLAVHDRVDEAERVAITIAKYNRVNIPDGVRVRLQEVADEEKQGQDKVIKYSYKDVFRGKTMIKITICSSLVWCSCAVVYYGMTFGVQGLSGNLHLNMFLLVVVEIPGYASTFWLLRKFGRKWTTVTFLVIGGVSLVATVIIKTTVDADYRDALITAMAVLAKMGIGGAWMIMYTYTNELYPTVVRTTGFGVSQTFARIGGILAPLILLMNDGNIVVPYVTMGILVVISAACLFLLPETKGRPLADTLTTKTEVEYMDIIKNEDGKTSEADESRAILDESPVIYKA